MLLDPSVERQRHPEHDARQSCTRRQGRPENLATGPQTQITAGGQSYTVGEVAAVGGGGGGGGGSWRK